jgi:hypothetical protein
LWHARQHDVLSSFLLFVVSMCDTLKSRPGSGNGEISHNFDEEGILLMVPPNGLFRIYSYNVVDWLVSPAMGANVCFICFEVVW